VALGCLVNTYAIPAVHVEVTAALTNTMSIAPYRGGGRPEPIFVTDYGNRTGGARARRRPGRTAPAQHDPRRLDAVQDDDAADLRQWRFRQEPRRLPERLAGYSAAAERAARGEGTRQAIRGGALQRRFAASGGRDYEHAEIRFDPAGAVVLITGSMDHGQGHGTTFKQVLSGKLGIDADLIRYRYGDSDLVKMGVGTFGSRSAQLAGSAIVTAADKLIDKGRRIAAHMMVGGARRLVVFEGGKFVIARHRPARSTSSDESPSTRSTPRNCPTRFETGFTRAGEFRSERCGDVSERAHLAEVEIDAETGEVQLTRYVAVDDGRHCAEPAVV